jgi:hypothetical protein
VKPDIDTVRLPSVASTAADPQNVPTPTPNVHANPQQSAATTNSTTQLTASALVSLPGTDLSPSVSSPPPILAALPTLESKLLRLRHYADELLSLSLHESHRLLQCEVRHLEEMLLMAKKERSERLVRGLEAEFPNLVDVRERIKSEGGKLGYFDF